MKVLMKEQATGKFKGVFEGSALKLEVILLTEIGDETVEVNYRFVGDEEEGNMKLMMWKLQGQPHAFQIFPNTIGGGLSSNVFARLCFKNFLFCKIDLN